jgi:hypothetical protein
MLKSSSIFKRNGAHLKKKNCPLSRFGYFEHAKTFKIYVKFWGCKLCSDEKYSKKIMTIQTIMIHL